MKHTAILIAAGAGVASAFPNAVLPRADPASTNPWQAPGAGDVRAPCPGLNTLANHGYINRNGKDITVDMAVQGFKNGFNMGSDIITAAAGSALSVCQQVTGSQCSAFNLDQLNTPHTFEHDASFSRQDYDFGEGNNHDFNQDVFNTVLAVWQDTDVIDYSYANAARLMRIQACQKADKAGWFVEADGTQLTEIAFYLGTMGTPQDGNARKDWVSYWWTHERLPFELGWSADQRSEHNQSTISNMINQILNAPAPPSKSSASTSSVAANDDTAVSTPASSLSVAAGGYGVQFSSAAAVSTEASSTTVAAVSTPYASTPAATSKSTPTGFASFANSSAPAPATTTFLTTSIAYVTTEITVTSCASTITDCPAESRTPMVITKTLSEFTTICPVTATMVPSKSIYSVVSDSTPAPAASSAAASSAPASSAPATSATPAAVTTSSSTPAPVPTTYLTTSVAYVTTEITVTSCASTITDCPAESRTPMVITKTLSEYTTICPVTATETPSSPSSSPSPSSVPAIGYSIPAVTSAAAVTTTPSSAPAPPPATTTFLTTSVAYVTTEITVTSCASTITDCPAESRTPMVITKTLSEFTTICPVTATMVPSVSSLVTSAAPVTMPQFSYPAPTVTYTYVSGGVVTIPCSSTDLPSVVVASTIPLTTTSTMVIPNPYYTSVPVESFPSVPATIVSQYSAATGAYAAPSLASQYTESGSAAIASATAPYVPPATVVAPSSQPAAATSAAPQVTPAAGGYGAAPGTASIVPTSAPVSIQQAGAGSKGVSGALAGLAVMAMLF